MGTAAFNIGGNTFCSAFHKKMYQTNQIMSADELNTFRIKYRHLKVVIIDEISMVGKRTFDLIDTRLQQLTGIRAPFGGLSVIAVGGFYQLKPVGDRLVFLDLDEDAKPLAPNSWKDHFKMYELVDIMRQKDDLKFAQLLNIRLNEMTEEDKNDLRKRVVDRNSGEYPRDAVHLFAEKAGMYKHNEIRPHHGLALYIKEHFEIQEVVKHHSQFCEFISAKLHSKRKGQLQVVVFYKYPKYSQCYT